ncbi:response regulator transcription factor [Patescibacteria group bacterium]|nr:response regulator transcription factor [Patescibacteria group bacterium]
MTNRESDHPEQGVVENPLSPSQQDALWKVGMGLSDSEIAASNGISPETVRNYLATAVQRLVAHQFMAGYETGFTLGNRRGSSLYAAIVAAEHGLIPGIPVDEHRRQELEFLKRYVQHRNSHTTNP